MSITLVLTLILLATQYSLASYSDSESNQDWTVPYYDNQQKSCIEKPKQTCIAEGGDCSIPLSVCCSGMKCIQEFWPLGKRCQGELKNVNTFSLNSRKRAKSG